MATTVARLEAILSADTGKFDRAMSKSETRMKRAGNAAKVGLAVGVGVGIAVLKSSVSAAMEAEKSQARLEQSFKQNVKGGLEPFKAKIEEASKAAINLGFDDEDLADSLGSLVAATGDYNKAQDAANVAMNLARFKGTSLEQATKTMTMAMGGSQRAVKQLGISVEPVTAAYDALKEKFTSVNSEGGKLITKQEEMRLKSAKLEDKQATLAEVIDTVRKKVRGQADAYAKTSQGEMDVFAQKTEELKEKLGQKLLPQIVKIVTYLNDDVIPAFEKWNGWMSKIGANQGLADIFKRILKSEAVLDRLHAISDAFKTMYGWIQAVIRGIAWLIDKIPSIPKLPKLPGFLDPRNIGDAGSRSGPGSISPRLYDELSGAQSMGLVLTSGYRPGARTKHGTPSDHGIYPSHAIDVAGPPNRMANFFRWLIGQTDVKQAFYDPLGSIFGGVLSSYREGGHSDHVHVATYDKGGYLRPGWNLAYNGLGRPERVGAGGDIIINVPNYVGSRTEFMSWLQNAAQQFKRQNGRSPF